MVSSCCELNAHTVGPHHPDSMYLWALFRLFGCQTCFCFPVSWIHTHTNTHTQWPTHTHTPHCHLWYRCYTLSIFVETIWANSLFSVSWKSPLCRQYGTCVIMNPQSFGCFRGRMGRGLSRSDGGLGLLWDIILKTGNIGIFLVRGTLLILINDVLVKSFSALFFWGNVMRGWHVRYSSLALIKAF